MNRPRQAESGVPVSTLAGPRALLDAGRPAGFVSSPLGDGETLERLRERTEDAVTRPAGSTTLLDANIPSDSQPGPGPDPGRGTTG